MKVKWNIQSKISKIQLGNLTSPRLKVMMWTSSEAISIKSDIVPSMILWRQLLSKRSLWSHPPITSLRIDSAAKQSIELIRRATKDLETN